MYSALTPGEKRWLAVGVLIGAVIAGIISAGVFFRLEKKPPESATAPVTPNPTNAGAAVQLSREEQRKIGVQTTEVRQESVVQEILAMGRVENKTMWVKAEVFDSDLDLARIRPGLTATITSDAPPGLRIAGKVDFIDPQSDPQTGTTRVRILVEDTATRLRPGMIVQAAIRVPLGMAVTVPRESVLDNGTDKIVYVVQDDGVFEQRRVQAGASLKDHYAITEGLAPGEKVVTNGVFLVDSQTRLTGGLTGMFGGSKSFAETTGAAPPPKSDSRITFRMEPDPPRGGRENTIHVSLVDASGKPISDANVRLVFVMPAMPAMNMAEMRSNAELKWNGSEYVGPIQIMMGGGWNVSIEARRGGALVATQQTHINAR